MLSNSNDYELGRLVDEGVGWAEEMGLVVDVHVVEVEKEVEVLRVWIWRVSVWSWSCWWVVGWWGYGIGSQADR